MSVADICFEVGYSNLSNFNRHFRYEMNLTPSEYRQGTEVTMFRLNTGGA
jgi:AraC-like DNA-binding protein